MVQCITEILLVIQWDQPSHAHPGFFAAPQWSRIVYPYWGLQCPSLPHRDIRGRGDPPACPPPWITWLLLNYYIYWEWQGRGPHPFLQETTTTPEGTVRYIELILNMVANTVTEEWSSNYEFRKALSLYMSILHNCRGFVDTYLPIINNMMLVKLWEYVSTTIPLTFIAIFQVWVSLLFYNPHLELAGQYNRGVMLQVFGHCTKTCEKM